MFLLEGPEALVQLCGKLRGVLPNCGLSRIPSLFVVTKRTQRSQLDGLRPETAVCKRKKACRAAANRDCAVQQPETNRLCTKQLDALVTNTW